MSTKTKINNLVIKNSLQIMRTAIKNGISVTEASRSIGYGKNYVSNAKLTLNERISTNTITKGEAAEFKRVYKQYEQAVA